MEYRYNTGGSPNKRGDCVCRAIAIAAGLPYIEVYQRLADLARNERRTKRGFRSSPRSGILVYRKWFKDYMRELGFEWVSCMQIGTGCQVHLRHGELPMGRLVCSLSRHYTAVIDGVINDRFDPQRNETRCVYGYWRKNE